MLIWLYTTPITTGLFNSFFVFALALYTLAILLYYLYTFQKVWSFDTLGEGTALLGKKPATKLLPLNLLVTLLPVGMLLLFQIFGIVTISSLGWSAQIAIYPEFISFLKFGLLVFNLFIVLAFLVGKNPTPVQFTDTVSTLIVTSVLLILLFSVTNLYSFVFLIELITLLILTVTVVSSYSVTIVSFSKRSNKQFFYSITIFFWIAVLTSLLLFFWLVIFSYTLWLPSFYVFDLLTTLSFHPYLEVSSSLAFYKFPVFFIIGFLIMMIKLGLPPFFVWKPAFFKGFPLNFLAFYLTVYYPSLLLFFINFTLNTCSMFLVYATTSLYALIFLAILLFVPSTFSYGNVKIFFAISSILNTLLMLLILFSSTLV